MNNKAYKPTIGIETHVQLKTKTKLFAAVGNDARSAGPNSLISHICAGLPGALPVLNREAVAICVRAAFALGTKPQKFSKFERKHYFYPDLPKGYQITQYEDPIISGGQVVVTTGGKEKTIGIERAHLEEDAGKNTHPPGTDYSLVDLNRAGTPLLEIVSRPDIGSPAEAKAYARELYLLMKYAGVTDGDLYHGHIRFDLNVSVSDNPQKPGIRTEIKNLNSFRSVEAAAQFEIKRQTEILAGGGKVIQETRGWDEAKQKTLPQRAKEEAEDYRYMPEPDVPPLELDESFVEEARSKMPLLPGDIRRQLMKLEVTPQVIEDILDRQSIVRPVMDVLEVAGAKDARRAAFWLISADPADENIEGNLEPEVDSGRLVGLSKMIDDGKLNSSAAKKVFDKMLSSPETPDKIAEKLNLLQVSDEKKLEKNVDDVISKNPAVAEDIIAGQTKAIGFLVGQVMAATKGQANPALVQEIIKRRLGV
ncbi:MAG TPA: Asp-tRNA(Asn)/Glu-tRNA(Gln) amidotransferase subunit GatB [Candidatus Saccharimonadales bacterium]|nr:Asp-tRNA(Asn)/Glu-tRNA(Gln) amidotransferase subunit GatB [Candidatus Saccharimonadales bacterium]